MALEDYTSYTEVDVGANRITFTGTDHINHRSQRNETTYLYDDKGAAHFGNFEHLVDAETDFEDAYSHGVPWEVANALGDIRTLRDASEKLIYSSFYRDGSSNLVLRLENFDGANGTLDAYTCLANTRYYLTIERSGTTGTIKIYSDSARTTLLDTLTLTVENDTFRYIYACSSLNTAQASRDMDVIMENLDLQEGETLAPSDTAKSSDTIKFDVEEHMSDTAKASDSNKFDAGYHKEDTAKANDDVSFQPEILLEDTAKASDSVSFEHFRAHILEDTAKASDSLRFDAEINLEDIAKASDTIIVPEPPLEPYPCDTFTLYGTSTNILFPKPEWNSPDNGITKNIGLFNFRSGRLSTVDTGIETQPLTFGGVVSLHADTVTWEDLTAMTAWLNSIKTAMNNGEKFTINELGSCLNGVYVINDFRFDTIVGTVDTWSWSLHLERVKDV